MANRAATLKDRYAIVVVAGATLGGLVSGARPHTEDEAAKKASRLAVLFFNNVSKELGFES
jgi:hypothetical protein